MGPSAGLDRLGTSRAPTGCRTQDLQPAGSRSKLGDFKSGAGNGV